MEELKKKGELIRSLRLLCKAITGRTSATPTSAINRYLRKHSDHYAVAITKAVKRTPASPPSLTIEASKEGNGPSGAQWPRRTKSIVMPCTLGQLTRVIIDMDAQAESDYGLSYGVQRAQRA
jgi:hypothetical protein